MNQVVAVIGVAYLTLETIYFGNHWLPQSGVEAVCDGIGLLILALAFVVSAERRR